jgi:hypothetical protein
VPSTLSRPLPTPRLELKQAILASGRRAWEVAYMADLTPWALSMIGSGRREIRADEAEALAKVLDRPLVELFPRDYPGNENGGEGGQRAG